ncbi:hypothetical protein BSK66_27575 [Paenibacillus odorifer]|uniref:hypothetical protein n=1 Tax=Paenibacillus TaxID=44249 RepID=UPI0003E29E0E|nr:MULTISPECIES: hypothetical protein [Paenibacillus]ETT61316.1 hypothetical protein C171_12678 [Paenibacillus sp. FSL H8-237]OMD13719.1 hypothetical protein BJP47_24125 [Paenibacillus odorifer]OME48949.1 hypothetical protein BSK66_27575 [Paenibacillus odorifer]
MYYYCPFNYSYSPAHYTGHQLAPRSEYNYLRGRVKKIIFEIEYPDGTQKVMMLDNAHDITHIAFNQKYVFPEDTHLFNVSPQDWNQNPAMIAYRTNAQAYPHYFTFDSVTGAEIAINPTTVASDIGDKPRPTPYCSSQRCGGDGGAFDPNFKILDPKILQPGGGLFDL